MKNSLKIILFLGLVSLFGDMVYETVRSIIGPYLGSLGASAVFIGFVFGIGEFLGYAVRIISGFVVDKTKNYWLFVFLGYSMIGLLPLIGITDNIYLISLLVILERVGKGLRAPAKDTILSIYTPGLKKGFVFGVHELADQIGAVSGPAIFSILLLLGIGYKNSFLFLFIPFILIILSMIMAKINSGKIIRDKTKVEVSHNLKLFYYYLTFIFLTSLGFIGFPLIGLHSVKYSIVDEKYIPFVYSMIMLIDGFLAIPIGLIYDKIGFKVMGILPFLIFFISIFSFSNIFILVIIGFFLWGIVISFYETVIRAFIADTIPIELKGKFFGIFNTIFGLSLFIGNSILGFLYEKNIQYIFYFIGITQILSFLFFIRIKINFKDQF
ncbi:MAG TPA: MFS transporter [Spirochaetota bacterium]|nr:MFS transporter [Spirochaetota bacterium]HOM38363.1 MFS transporter [Spirochaetota bacterium]HPQ48419.1 MFS transporter [Spirochaetota bacterium]